METKRCVCCNLLLQKGQRKYCKECKEKRRFELSEKKCLCCGKQLTVKQHKYCCVECQRISRPPLSIDAKEKISKAISISNKNRTGKVKFSEEARKNLSNSHKGIKKSKEWKQKISKSLLGNKNNLKGLQRKHTQESKRKMRLKLKERIEKLLSEYGENLKMSPNWNPRGCEFFKKFDIENNTQGQYATNGGEFYIEELGYWVDYINHDLKLIIEYDEEHHYDKNQLKERDVVRQKEIQEKFPNYEFRRIRESETDV